MASMPKIGAIILAAGRSTRMKSQISKVLQPLCGKMVVEYPYSAALSLNLSPIVIVASQENKEELEKLSKVAVQEKPLGTGHAVMSAKNAISGKCEYLLIIPGDVPLLRQSTLELLIKTAVENSSACSLLTTEMPDGASYGRVIRDANGDVKAIKEAKDASAEELMIKEINSSVYCVRTKWLFEALEEVSPKNSQKEYYLTDIVKIAVSSGQKVSAVCITDHDEVMGINTRKELALAARIMRGRILDELMDNGVGIVDELHTYIDIGVKAGVDTVIYPHSFIRGKTVIGKNCKIENGVVLDDAEIKDNAHIKPYSVLEGAVVGENAVIGPFARLRPGTVIENNAKIGNFVEVKKSLIKNGAKANHLSYIGDAVIGERTNVGCGTITCNYDGEKKHRTEIGSDVFVGSDVQFVAPVKIGDGAFIGAGSTITEDVPANSLAIARGRQVVKKGWKKSD